LKPSQAHKNAAFRNLQRANIVVQTASFATVAVASLPGVGPALALAPATIGFLYASRASAQSQIVHDPPREDYEKHTSISLSKLNFKVLAEVPSGLTISRLAEAQDEATRSLRAMIRASERSWGAQIANKPTLARERESEATYFVARAGEYLVAAGETKDFQSFLEDYRNVTADVSLRRTTLEAVLPDATLSLLYRLGIPRGYVRTRHQTPTPDVPIAQFLDALRAASNADSEYGAFLTDTPSSRLFSRDTI
jgi:hypothetical protein